MFILDISLLIWKYHRIHCTRSKFYFSNKPFQFYSTPLLKNLVFYRQISYFYHNKLVVGLSIKFKSRFFFSFLQKIYWCLNIFAFSKELLMFKLDISLLIWKYHRIHCTRSKFYFSNKPFQFYSTPLLKNLVFYRQISYVFHNKLVVGLSIKFKPRFLFSFLQKVDRFLYIFAFSKEVLMFILDISLLIWKYHRIHCTRSKFYFSNKPFQFFSNPPLKNLVF